MSSTPGVPDSGPVGLGNVRSEDRTGWEFPLVRAENLGLFWDLVLPGIHAVRDRGHAGWRAEDMYFALKSNAAALHLCVQDGRYVGFVVLTRIQDPFSGEKIMFIWAAYGAEPGYVDKGISEIEQIARAEGMDKMVLHSPRRAWLRRLRRHGFGLGQYIIEKRLTNA